MRLINYSSVFPSCLWIPFWNVWKVESLNLFLPYDMNQQDALFCINLFQK